ncbi:glycoside hydrolase family 26 protein [Spongisporangium articulatum]|uniref:Glycoside hydrolase family 26 protein n=1 Tax=Spongisporangium articulatum TaxID=3362603 RepID=A0ABW8ASA6_9ACTN
MRHANQQQVQLSRVTSRPGRFDGFRGRPTRILLPLAGLAVVVAVALVLHPVHFGDEPTTSLPGAQPPPSPSAAATVDAATANEKVRYGVFVGTDASQVRRFERVTGQNVVDVLDFGQRGSWDDIANPATVLAHWRGDTKHRLILAVPLLPTSLKPTRLSAMKAGAAGDYNQYFKALAQRLVAADHQDAVLRIGWEFNIKDWAWGTPDAKSFRAFFRQVVTTMRSVPGADFWIDWNVNNGFTPYDGTKYWPGDAYVDSVGVDAYDIDGTVYPYPKNCRTVCREKLQERAWDEVIFGGERGLQFWSQFAAEHDKPLALSEWGLWDRLNDHTGGAENPFYIRQMHDFITSPLNNVAYAAYFNSDDPESKHSLLDGEFPASAKVFKDLFGGKTSG